MYNVDAGALVGFVKAFRLLLGRYRRLGNMARDQGGDMDWVE